MAEYHDVEVVRRGDGYRAECSCGRDGRIFKRASDAEEDADEHVYLASEEA
jgi:hypothetical protein